MGTDASKKKKKKKATPKDFDHRAPHPSFNGNDGHAQ
jgi:hypothetical protein